MPQRSNRPKRRTPGNGVNNGAASPQANGSQYAKYLPEWMKDNGGVAPARPRVRRAPRQRPVGGYAGKLASNDR